MGVSYERKDKYDINDLLQIMEILRSEQGCPWDKEQTHIDAQRYDRRSIRSMRGDRP